MDAKYEFDRLVREAATAQASDLHLEPIANGYELRRRIDGHLVVIDRAEVEAGRALVHRAMVAANLLTYRLDRPQEGRAVVALGDGASLEVRVAIMPTLHGLRAVVRLPAHVVQRAELSALRLPDGVLHAIEAYTQFGEGMLTLVGPAGSGKTTLLYAVLRRIHVQHPGLSVVSLEDPIERSIEGVTQVEVKPEGDMTYEAALRSLLRQDPQVLALGEVRDRDSASLAVQAALSGHRVVTTMHAPDVAGAIVRLLEMGIEPYQLASSLYGVLAMRLVRKRNHGRDPQQARGRQLLASFGAMDDRLRRAVLQRAPRGEIEANLGDQSGYAPLSRVGQAYIENQVLDSIDIDQALGIRGKHR
ncbi:MAG: ATPase, T2SS/T4P/T4SS family [Planctomycetota bacterium]